MLMMLTTLIELQRLKRLERTGWMLRRLPSGTESVAAHSFGVSVTAMLLADELNHRGVAVNLEKTMRVALLHDWAEVRVGDLPRTATSYFGASQRKRAEREAFSDIVRPVEGSDSLYASLYDDYEERNSIEAKLVKAADVIDLLVQTLALERSGIRGLDEFWEVATQPDFQLEEPARQVVQDVIQALLQARSDLA